MTFWAEEVLSAWAQLDRFAWLERESHPHFRDGLHTQRKAAEKRLAKAMVALDRAHGG